jgi:hypothetical protein
MKAMWTKIQHAHKKQKPTHTMVERKHTQTQSKATKNPPPSAVGFTHSGLFYPI